MKAFKPCLYFFVITLFVFSFQTNVRADADSHRKAADELLNTMDLNTLLSESIDSMLQIQLSNNPELKLFEKTMKAFFNKHMSGESLREEFIDIYTETFTEKELRIINAFYNTPTGKKALKEMPSMMSKGAEIGQRRVRENLPELQRMIAEETERIQQIQQRSE